MPEPCSQAFPRLRSGAPLISGLRAIQAKVICVDRNSPRQGAPRVHSPKPDLMVGHVIEESEIVLPRSNSESVDPPRPHLAKYPESDEAQTNVWALPDVDQTPSPVLQLLYPNAKRYPVLFAAGSDVKKRVLEVQLLLINGSRAAYSERFKTTLEFDEGSKMFAVVCVETQHVALKKKVIPEWLFPPVVVAGLLPHFSRFSTDRQVPVRRITAQWDVLYRIPEVLPEGRVAQETPVLVFPE